MCAEVFRDRKARYNHTFSLFINFDIKGINKFSAKLAPNYEGSLKIVEIKSPTVYILESVSEDTRRITKTRVLELKRYIPPKAVKICLKL